MVEALESKVIVDPAKAINMDGGGGVSGAIKGYFKEIGKLPLYLNDIHNVKPKNGLVCPNGEVRYTNTGGIEIIHTSVPDLRNKHNLLNDEATIEAKQKMFEAYFHVFEYAHLHQVDPQKMLHCPLLGAGIYKWPQQESATIAGRALAAFRTAYGDRLQINICMRPVDFTEQFTQENLVTAITEGMELQTIEPMKPSGMSSFEFTDATEMRNHLMNVSLDELQMHYNEYTAAQRPKTEKDARLIEMLKLGISKIFSSEANPENKAARLIPADRLKQFAKKDNYIQDLYNSLDMPELCPPNILRELFGEDGNIEDIWKGLMEVPKVVAPANGADITVTFPEPVTYSTHTPPDSAKETSSTDKKHNRTKKRKST